MTDDRRTELFCRQQAKDRFYEVKETIDERTDGEVTNDDVIELLCDVWWLHEERTVTSV